MAETPTREEIGRRVKRADDLAQAAKSSWFVMLGTVAFAAVAVAGVADRDFFLKDVTTELPIVGVSVPTVGFFVAAPIVLLAVYANFQFYVLKLWTALAEVPSALPTDDARRNEPLADALQPWLLVDAALALKPDASPTLFTRSLVRSRCSSPGGRLLWCWRHSGFAPGRTMTFSCRLSSRWCLRSPSAWA